MYHIHCLNKISPKGTALLTDNYTIVDDRNQADGVLVRSADMHNAALPESLLAVARAGAGVNNIPLSDCAEAGVVVFNTPGANANSVMELALCGMLLSSRDVVGGINWVQTVKDDPDIAKLVEKGKSKFAGHEIRHKKLGVIGLGAVGGPLANAARNLGMTVYGCDPFISIEAAWHLDSHIVRVNDRDEIYSKCDIISLHTPLLDDTRGMINAEALAKMKDGVIVLNFARDLLVDDDAMAAALASGFTMYIYKQFGYSLPHSATSQWLSGMGTKIYSISELQPGDLVFFNDPSRNKGKACSHAGIYIGNGQHVHASSSRNGGVITSDLTSGYYNTYFVGGLRLS